MSSLRTTHFCIRVLQDKEIILPFIKTTAHFQNILLILIEENYEAFQQSQQKNYRDWLLNKRLIRALVAKTNGGKNAAKVSELREAFGNKALFQDLLAVGSQLKEKNIAQLVGKLKSAFKSFFTKRKKGLDANPPKPKKLRNIKNFSLPLDQCSVSFCKKNRIKINFDKKMQEFSLNHDSLLAIVGSLEAIQSVEVIYKHEELYFSISYHKPPALTLLSADTGKQAALDLGVNNTCAVFIDDQSSESMVISGQKLLQFNKKNNYKIDRAKSREKLAANAINKRKSHLKKTLNKDFVSEDEFLNSDIDHIALKWKHSFCKKDLAALYRKRHRFYKDKFHKMATRILEYLSLCGVKTLYLSRNLGKAKQDKGLRKDFNKKFHPIPIVKLIDYLMLKGADYGIAVFDDIDEAYTSQCSCVSGDVVEAQKLKKEAKPPKLADVFKGRRAGDKYFDRNLGVCFHADLNGACNHISVARGFNGFSWLKDHLWKLTHPKYLSCDSLFLDCSLKSDLLKLKDPLRRSYAAKFSANLHVQVCAS